MASRKLTTTAGIATCVGALLTFSVLSCGEDTASPPTSPGLATTAPSDPDATGPALVPAGELSPAGLALPFKGTATSNAPAFFVDQQGTGPAAVFRSLGSSNRTAIRAVTNGNGEAIVGLNTGTGEAAVFELDNVSSFSTALRVATNGNGHGLSVSHTGAGNGGFIWRLDAAEILPIPADPPALRAVNSTASGHAGLFEIFDSANADDALVAHTTGTGNALNVNHSGSSGDIAIFRSGGTTQVRIAKDGTIHHNGPLSSGTADLAEAFAVEGSVGGYEPGDVLAISPRSVRKVEKSAEAYSTRVIGVHATAPAILLGVDDPHRYGERGKVAVAVTGVVPTKVTAQNGAIRPGDILVASSRAGHAMKASESHVRDGRVPNGAIIGKALEPFDGPGGGRILVMVNVK